MKRTLYLKILLGYLLFGILGFLTVATFTSHQSMKYMEKKEARDLYRGIHADRHDLCNELL